MKKNIVILLAFLGFFELSAAAQAPDGGFTQKGKVVDVKGEAIIGANIRVLNQKNGAISDVNGNFSVKIDTDSAKITISYVGHIEKTVSVKRGGAQLEIVMKENLKELDELVIIGYGAQRKTALTSSIEVIKNDAILRMPTPNLDQALNGQVAGLQVMSSSGDPSSPREANIRIRGINGTPLLVVDGVPRYAETTSDFEMRLSDLSPDDVESISILKDAAAGAVYGSRAANGVILVTTKRGTADKKIRVQYRGQYNVQQATKFPEFVGAYDFAKLFNRAVDNTPGTLQQKYTDEALEKIRANSAPNEFGNENLIDYLKKTASSTTHSLSVQGGGDAVRYFLSGGYTNTQGLYSGVGHSRYNYSVKLDVSLLKELTLLVDMLGSRSANKNTGYGTIDAMYSFSPLQVLRFTSGEPASINGGNPLIGINGLGGYLDSQTNFSTLTATLNYKPLWAKGLSVYAKGTTDYNVSVDKTFGKPVTLYLYKDNALTEDPLSIYPKAKISLAQRDMFAKNTLLEVGANYNRSFSAVHDVALTLVANYQDKNNRYMEGTNNDLPGPYPEVIGTALDMKLTGSEFYTQRASLIGRATYGYSNRYFIEGNFRVDGSTQFAPENRWAFFPSVSGSWVLSNEDFFKNWKQRTLSNVKFRTSAGLLGDDGSIDQFSYLLNYKYFISSGYPIGGGFKPGVGVDTGTFPNRRLQWGKSEDYNAGVDLGFWNNRFEISYEYYWRYLTNMIRPVEEFNFPPSTGTNGGLPLENYGKIKAWGWDLTLTHRNTVGKFKYDVALTMTKTDDMTLDAGDESSLESQKRRAGKSSMLWWLYQADGLFRSPEDIAALGFDQDGKGNSSLAPGDIRYVDVKKDGILSEADKIGVKNSSYPNMSYSVKLGAGYSGFFFNAMLQGVAGYKQLISDVYSLNANSLQRFQNYHLTNTWTPENPNAEYPRVKFATSTDNNRRASTFWIQDCDFIRLKSLSVGYAFQPGTLKKMKITSLSIALQGSNLFTWSSLKNSIDPESLRGYPIQRSYGITANVGF